MYSQKGFETCSELPRLGNEDGYHPSDESLFASFKAKKYDFVFSPFTSPFGTLNEDHAFYYSDLLDIVNHERDPKRRRHRFEVILHGSKAKQTRPLFQHNEGPTTWTSSLRLTIKREKAVGFTQLDENFQMMVELGFVNHLLMFMTHSYRYLYEENELNLPVAPENVDCFMYEKEDFMEGEHSHYPYYSAEILSNILLMSNEATFKAIIERYFTREQNGPNSSKMIDDGRHVIMNGVGVLYKVLKYGVVTQRDLAAEIIRTIFGRCGKIGLDVPDFIVFNDTYPLHEAVFQFIKDYQQPERMWNEFNKEGFYQSDIFPELDTEYHEQGKNNARRWLINSLSNSAKTIIILTLNANRKGLRRKLFTRDMINDILDLIDKFPHVDKYFTLFNRPRIMLINLLSVFLYDEEVLDSEGNLEKPFAIDYQLLEELTDFPIERICKMIFRIDYDPFYSISALQKLMKKCKKEDIGIEDDFNSVVNQVIMEELSLIELLALLSHNPLLASKIADFENGKMISMLLTSTNLEKNQDDTNMNSHSNLFSRPNIIVIADEMKTMHRISIPRFVSAYLILGNILQVLPDLNNKINPDGLFYKHYYVKYFGAKISINNTDVASKNYQLALMGYRTLFPILNDFLEENYSTPETIKIERVTIASNIGEMAIRLNNKVLAEKYVQYALKMDPDHEKSKKRLETIKKLK